jgi:predicted nucleotide-binding protein (sugar kinase/HSP70/actin superfamily)
MEYMTPNFTKDMVKTHKILIPNMAVTQFRLLQAALECEGYNVEVLGNCGSEVAQLGLKYVHNDTCYPALLVIGQFIDALNSGKYDLDHTALLITQTGGGCRASNYIGFIRRALEKADMTQIPVISINLSGLEENPGFKITPDLAIRLCYAAEFGDIMMKCIYRMRPYEQKKGTTDRIHKKWEKICIDFVSAKHLSHTRFKQICRTMIRDFDHIPITDEKKPRVGIVGEILVKFLPAANNHLAELLESEGAEPVVPDLIDFFCYCFYNTNFKVEHLGFKKSSSMLGNTGIKLINWLRSAAVAEFKKSEHFDPPADVRDLAKYASPIVSCGNQTGEGWFLTGEMMELIHSDVYNIVCIQPFACLPNHIVGKGVIKAIRKEYPKANIAAIDYDPGASEVNQLNRIKLMLSTAQKNLKAEEEAKNNN